MGTPTTLVPRSSSLSRSTLPGARRILLYLVFAGSLALFIAALEFTYAVAMAPRFGYLGYIYHEPDRFWMLASYVMLLVVSAFLPYRTDRISGFAVWFLYASLLVPVATVPFYGSTRPPSDTFVFGLYCAAIWVAVALAVRRRAPIKLVPISRNGSRLVWVLVAAVSLVTYVYLAAVFGITFNIVSVFEVYDTRLLYRDEVIPSVPLLGYLITNQGNVINPLLMAVGVVRRRWPLVVLGILGQLIIYSTTGYKTVLISIPLCIVIALFLRSRQYLSGILIVVSATVMVWASIVIDQIVSLGLIDIIVSRVFLTAGYLLPMYRDVYDSGQWALWDYSFLGPLVETRYTTSPGFFVGTIVLGRPDVQLNASLFADGYANLGLLGIAIEAAFLVLLLILADSASRRLPLSIVLPTALLPIFALANGSPFTALLSYGFALLIVSLALYPRQDAGLVPGGDSIALDPSPGGRTRRA